MPVRVAVHVVRGLLDLLVGRTVSTLRTRGTRPRAQGNASPSKTQWLHVFGLVVCSCCPLWVKLFEHACVEARDVVALVHWHDGELALLGNLVTAWHTEFDTQRPTARVYGIRTCSAVVV